MKEKRSKKHKGRRKSAEILDSKPNPTGRLSFNGVATYINNIGKFLNGEFSPTICDGELENKIETVIPKDILPDMRDIDEIVEDVARKEILLDAMLESTNSLKEDSPEAEDSFDGSTYNLEASVESSINNQVEKISRQIFEIELEQPKHLQMISDHFEKNRKNCEQQVTSVTSIALSIDHSCLEKYDFSNKCDVSGPTSGENDWFVNCIDKNQSRTDEKVIESNSQAFELPADISNFETGNQDAENCNERIESSKVENTISSEAGTVESSTQCCKLNIVNDFQESEVQKTENCNGYVEHTMHDIPLTTDDESEMFMSYNNLEQENVESDIQLSQLTFPFEITESHFCGNWHSISCPDFPVSLTSWNRGLVVCSPKLNVYVLSENSWSLMNYRAQHVIPSPCGTSAIKLHCALALYSEHWKSGTDWKKTGRDVQWAVVNDKKMWFISNKKAFCLSIDDGHTICLKCESALSKLYLYNNDLLAISENGRLLIHNNNEWKTISGIKNAKLLSIGPQQLVWVVDSHNSLFIIDKLKIDKQTWWQVPIPDFKKDIVSICSTEDGFYIGFRNSKSISFNKHFVTGHRWNQAELNLECTQITAAGVFEDKGCIWILDPNNKLLALDSSLNILKELIPPCNVTCIASAPEALWLLSDEGCVYLRQDITYRNPVGVHWRKLNLEQLHSQVEMVAISCGPDVVWACDIRGKIVMLVGSPYAIANDTFNPAWVYVDGKPIDNNTFTKVYVGPDTYMVWALDNAGNIYVREAVFPTFPLGTGWVHVPDIKASHLTISSDAVYALNKDGVYKRIGISQSNYIGDAWLYLRVQLDYIAASFDLGLFGICSKTRNLVSHIEREFPMSDQITVEKDWALL